MGAYVVRFKDALRISEVEHALDNKPKPGAIRNYSVTFQGLTYSQDGWKFVITQNGKKEIKLEFIFMLGDNSTITTYNPGAMGFLVKLEDIINLDDWEPL